MSVRLLETIEVGSGGSAGFDFQSIPADGTTLIMVCHLRSNNAAGAVQAKLAYNNGGQTEYAHMQGTGNGRTDTIGNSTNAEITYMPGTDIAANNFATYQITIPAYKSSRQKGATIYSGFSNSIVSDAWGGFASVNFETTDVISSLQLTPISGTFAEHSIASLYMVIEA
jgi:hypothetical protein